MPLNQLNRRSFIGQSALATGLLLASGQRAMAAPSEQINLGIIGMGWRGGQLAELFGKLPGVRIDTVCDVDSERVAEAAKLYSVEKQTTDFQTILDDPNIDAVIVTTGNHWHCLAGILACQAGKHVYVEKPLGHNLWEQRQLINAAQRYNRVAQIGTQQRSDPMQAQIKQFLHEEQGIGTLTGAVACRYGERKPIGQRNTPLTPPKTVNYDRWLGPAQEQELFRDQFHYDWHWDWNTGSGEMGNWGVHIMDDVRNVAFNDEINLPSSVTSIGGRVEWNDAGNTPNWHVTLYESESIPLVCSISNLKPVGGRRGQLREKRVATGYVVYGENGHYEGQRGWGVAYDKEGKEIRRFKGNSGEPHHYQNFIDAVRSNSHAKLNAPIETGHYSTAWCHLGNAAMLAGKPANEAANPKSLSSNHLWQSVLKTMSDDLTKRDASLKSSEILVGPTLNVDRKAERFVETVTPQAEQLFKRTYREGYAVPEVSPKA